jgi:hypothetical protein
MISYEQYVAGWLDSSIRDFLEAFPPRLDSMKYVLVTCLDSSLKPETFLEESAELRSLARQVRVVGDGLLLSTKVLLEADSSSPLFFGFDEVWFFPGEVRKPKPDSAWLVGPARIDQEKLDKLGAWMTDNACSLGLGDGEGLNFIIKARGLVRHLLGHSINQPPPGAAFEASPASGVAG